jgi:AcrR family transcriptional regulator
MASTHGGKSDERQREPVSHAQPPGGTGLPASMELAWGIRERTARGPKPGLTLERIVAAAVSVANTDGLAGVSMSRVAAELGASTMSLYRYVGSKDELLTLMVDAALGAPPAAIEPAAGWRVGVTRWAEGLRDAYQRNPWSLRVPIAGPPFGPNNVAWLENALRCLAATPLNEQQKLSTVLLVSGFVRNDTTLTADIAASIAAAGGQPLPSYGATLSRLTDATRFPAIHRAIASGYLDDDEELGAEFDFGLERILDGVERLIEQLAAPTAGSGVAARGR